MKPMSKNDRNTEMSPSFGIRKWAAKTKQLWMIAVFIIVEIPYGWAAWRLVVTGKGWYFGAMGLFVVIVPWGWLWDIFSGFYHPTILQWPLPQQDNQELSFWHISHSDPNNFNDGIQLNMANTVFLGEGFYSWARAQDCAQALAKHPKLNRPTAKAGGF